MGEVWRARHRLLARAGGDQAGAARAMLAGGTDADARTSLRRFEREAQATAALTSPHTIRLFDFGVTDEGSFYYVMELLTGRDLASLVAQFGPLPPTRVIFLLRQVCHSLAEAHSRGLVHRDIKPANIFVCRMGLELRLRQGPRLRPRAGDRPERPAHDADAVAGDARGRRRHARLHGARSDRRPPGGGPPRRHLRARLRRLLPADRPAGVPGRHADAGAD